MDLSEAIGSAIKAINSAIRDFERVTPGQATAAIDVLRSFRSWSEQYERHIRDRERYVATLEAALLLWKLRAGTDPTLADLSLDTAAILENYSVSDPQIARDILNKAVALADRREQYRTRWG